MITIDSSLKYNHFKLEYNMVAPSLTLTGVRPIKRWMDLATAFGVGYSFGSDGCSYWYAF